MFIQSLFFKIRFWFLSCLPNPLDFVQLPSWYMWTMQKESSDYFDPNGEYYQLRINDVINCYLIACSLEV